MNKKAGALIFLVSLLAILALPLFAVAANNNATGIPYWGVGGLISCTGSVPVAGVSGGNPAGLPTCTSLCNLIQTFVNIIFFIMTLCLFVLAPAMFAVGGVMMMVSGANPEMLSKGKSVLLGTVIGIAITLCSYLLVATFVSVLNTTTSNGAPSVFGSAISCPSQ